jgi:hypothetical protein
MKSKPVGCLAATALGAAITVAAPAMARGGGGMHGGGGFGGGGMHGGFGGMHGGFGGGGTHFGTGFGGGGMRFGGGGFRGGMVTGRSVVVPGGNRFVGAPFAGLRVVPSTTSLSRNHQRFRNFAFVGAAPFFYDYAAYGNGCWRQEWTGYGWQWVNVCYGYGY